MKLTGLYMEAIKYFTLYVLRQLLLISYNFVESPASYEFSVILLWYNLLVEMSNQSRMTVKL